MESNIVSIMPNIALSYLALSYRLTKYLESRLFHEVICHILFILFPSIIDVSLPLFWVPFSYGLESSIFLQFLHESFVIFECYFVFLLEFWNNPVFRPLLGQVVCLILGVLSLFPLKCTLEHLSVCILQIIRITLSKAIFAKVGLPADWAYDDPK